MAQSSTTYLDAGMFEQALAVLDRARPSPREDRLFRLLNVLVWGVVGLTALYLWLRLTGFQRGDALVWIARAVALAYVFIIPALFFNWRLIQKLRRAARLRKRLAPSFKRRLTDQFKARRRQHLLANLSTSVLSLVGMLVAFLGVLGLVLQAIPDGEPTSSARITFFVVASVFGLSCVSLHFITRGRERLQVIAELRASLLASRNSASESQLTAEEYDEVTRIERLQIAADRRRSVRAASDKVLEETFSSKEHRAVRDAKVALPPATLVKVQACIDNLTAHPRAVNETAELRNGISYLRVPETVLELGFTIDWDAREIRVLSLNAPSDGDRPSVAPEGTGDGRR